MTHKSLGGLLIIWRVVVKYLAIDPGESTGWATFKEDGNLGQMGTLRGREPVYEKLSELAPSVIIMENYKLYPWLAKEQSWSPFETVRIIGAVEYYAYLHNAQVILQDPSIKSIGYLWAGIKKPKNHALSHESDAYVHGVYYLQKQGIRKPQQGRAQ